MSYFSVLFCEGVLREVRSHCENKLGISLYDVSGSLLLLLIKIDFLKGIITVLLVIISVRNGPFSIKINSFIFSYQGIFSRWLCVIQYCELHLIPSLFRIQCA